MKNKDYLTVRQEELMNFLWKVNEPLTANEMAERLAEDGWHVNSLRLCQKTIIMHLY